jgi:hypothetical protein
MEKPVRRMTLVELRDELERDAYNSEDPEDEHQGYVRMLSRPQMDQGG